MSSRVSTLLNEPEKRLAARSWCRYFGSDEEFEVGAGFPLADEPWEDL
jgi:hypothetical protein